METMETLEYRGVIDPSGGSLVICSAWDDDGNLVRFAGDWRMVEAIPAGAEVEVPSWAILSRRPAFEVIT